MKAAFGENLIDANNGAVALNKVIPASSKGVSGTCVLVY